MIRVALIGYGLGGAVFHAPLISVVPELELAAVVTSDDGRRTDARHRHPAARVLDSAHQVWDAAGDFDLVVVAAPNRRHVPLAREALTAGLPVVVDKPVAATAAQARELADLAADRGLVVFPFHNRRWDGDHLTLRRLLDDDALGTVTRFESRFERWRPDVRPGWKESAEPADAAGILYDLGPHLIDQAVLSFGRPDRVYAELDVRRPGAAAVDDAFVALAHPGGVRSHLWCSAVTPAPGPRLRVLGDRAGYEVWGMDGQEEALRAGLLPGDGRWDEATRREPGRLGVPGATDPVHTEPGAYREFYAGVARTLLHGAPPPVPMADAVTGLEVIDAALRSAREGRTVELAG